MVEGTNSTTEYHLAFVFKGTERIYPLMHPPGSQGGTLAYASVAVKKYISRMERVSTKRGEAATVKLRAIILADTFLAVDV